MIPGYNYAQIETIDGGEALRKLNYELEQAVKNCLDVNTTRKKRVLTIKITLEPDELRKELMVEYETKSVLQGEAPGSDIIMVGKGGSLFVSAKEQLTFGDKIERINDEEVAND